MYYISTSLRVYSRGYQGKIALKWKRKGCWNIILCRGDYERYLRTIQMDVFNLDSENLKKLVDEPLKRLFGEYRCYSDLEESLALDMPDKGFKVLENIWVRMDRKRGTYTLCMCDGYRIVKRLKYLTRYQAHRLKELVRWMSRLYNPKNGEEEVRRYLKQIGVQLSESTPETRERPSVEDEGYGGLAESYAEDGYILDEVHQALEDGDIERARWLLNSPEEAREYGVDEDTISYIFGEEKQKFEYR
jgi:hypothetical protein